MTHDGLALTTNRGVEYPDLLSADNPLSENIATLGVCRSRIDYATTDESRSGRGIRRLLLSERSAA